ncbi:MAG: hypothetical protein EXR83_14450 [Gammaproteobacteria bacterium]|nr:hypothetical protein [Gammaproteobacteria bacterium]
MRSTAPYATPLRAAPDAREAHPFGEFLRTLVSLDHTHRIAQRVWHAYPGSIRLLADKQDLFPAYWRYRHDQLPAAEWREPVTPAKRETLPALARGETVRLRQMVRQRA